MFFNCRFLILLFCLSFMLSSCKSSRTLQENVPVKQYNAERTIWDEQKQDKQMMNIQWGIPAFDATTVIYKRLGKSVLKIELMEPSAVAVADKPYHWGYFQFPNIYKSISGDTIVTSWNMSADAASAYGKGGSGRRISIDNGKTWHSSDKSILGGGLVLSSGEMLSVHTPVALKMDELDLPAPISKVREGYGRNFTLFRHDELPEVLRGIYINRWDKNGTFSRIHASLNDTNLVRYADGDLLPIVWWGDMYELPDGSIIAGIYPSFYENINGKVDPSCVSFYQSFDKGVSWHIKGKIPYIYDAHLDPNGNKRLALGWTEPAFTILTNGTYLCVIRTTDGYGDSPMYISRSFDEGVSWSHPVPFTPAGVLPKLLELDNGILVLASGRPGMQLRFSYDGKGEEWTDPFELIPYVKGENSAAATCGYPRIISNGPNSFLIAYSDFKYPIENGELRKAIIVREIKVTKLVK